MSESSEDVPDYLRGRQRAGAPSTPDSPSASSSPTPDVWLGQSAVGGSQLHAFAERPSPVSADQTAAVRPARAPLPLLLIAGGLALVGTVLGLTGGDALRPALMGWFLSGIGAFSMVAVYLAVDSGRRGRGGYVAGSADAWAYRVAILLALLGLVVCCARIGLYVGRL